jgi:hypothetical protein
MSNFQLLKKFLINSDFVPNLNQIFPVGFKITPLVNSLLHLNIFPRYLINGTIVRGKLSEPEMCVVIYCATSV